MNKKILTMAVTSVLGLSASALINTASAAVTSYEWSGVGIYLSPVGEPLSNTSARKGENSFQTPVSGVMMFDDTTGAGTGSINPYGLLSGSLPAQAMDMSLQAIGDGIGGAGTLVIANMLLDWNGQYGIPISMVWDAAGFFGASATEWSDGVLDQADVAGYGAVPASDGTYTNATWGYMNLGPVPIATTEFNTTNHVDCVAGADTNYSDNNGGGCMGVAINGVIPMLPDTDVNNAKYGQGDGTGIGGSPMQDGPFKGFSFNYEILSMTIVDNPSAPNSIAPYCEVGISCPPPVPVPAAIWLFGSGLLGLMGIARRKKSSR